MLLLRLASVSHKPIGWEIITRATLRKRIERFGITKELTIQ